MAVADVPAEVRVIESLKQGWTNMWPQFWILLGLSLLVGLVSIIGQPQSFLSNDASWQLQLGLGGFGFLFSVLVAGPLGLGLVKAHLTVSRGEKPEFGDLGYGFKRYPQAVLLGLLSALIVIGGFILLIIPGIYFAVKLTFATYRFVQDDMDAMDAIKASWDDVKDRWWRTFALFLISIPIAIAGLIALFVGVFIAEILITQMTTVYFRSIDAGGE